MSDDINEVVKATSLDEAVKKASGKHPNDIDYDFIINSLYPINPEEPDKEFLILEDHHGSLQLIYVNRFELAKRIQVIPFKVVDKNTLRFK